MELEPWATWKVIHKEGIEKCRIALDSLGTPEGLVPREIAERFIRESAWWDHPSAGNVRARRHAHRIYGSESDWKIDFQSNTTFYVGKAITRCRQRISEFLDRSTPENFGSFNDLKLQLRYAIYHPLTSSAIEFGYCWDKDIYYSYGDDFELGFGNQLIKTSDFIRTIFDIVPLKQLRKQYVDVLVTAPRENPMTIAEYHQLIESGVVVKDDRVELIEGRLVSKIQRTPQRHHSIWKAQSSLSHAVPAGWYVASGQPITLEEYSEFEPDVVVVRGNARDYRDRRPGADDLALVVDVVEAVGGDIEVRKGVYARAGVPVCWVIHTAEHRIEVYSDLTNINDFATYWEETDSTASDKIPFVIEGREIGGFTVRELTPRW